MTFMNTIMSGASAYADDQMRRLAEEAGLLDKSNLVTEQCKTAARASTSWPQERQDSLLEIAKCRYVDRLMAEYVLDGVSPPDELNGICVI